MAPPSIARTVANETTSPPLPVRRATLSDRLSTYAIASHRSSRESTEPNDVMAVPGTP